MSTGQFGYGGIPGCCVDPVCGYQILSSYFHVSQVSRQTYIETIQPRPFEEWIEKGHQRDANLCGAYARPTNEHSLVRGGEGYNQGSFVYFTKACGGWAGLSSVAVAGVWSPTANLKRDWFIWKTTRWEITCPHAQPTTSVVLFANTRN